MSCCVKIVIDVPARSSHAAVGTNPGPLPEIVRVNKTDSLLIFDWCRVRPANVFSKPVLRAAMASFAADTAEEMPVRFLAAWLRFETLR